MKKRKFNISDFFRADAIPKEAFRRVAAILRSGDLFRYAPVNSEVSLLEKNFSRYLEVKYALAVNSCSSAMFLSLLACGIKPGDKVLVPAFTFTAVPSAIMHAGAIPIFIECNSRFSVDLEDFERKINTKGVKAVLLSHMRGYTSDLDRIIPLCEKNKVVLIEDAAHSLGVLWNNKPVGTYGKVGCYSFQSYKIINGGEGGLLVTNDEEVIVKAILMSGAYEEMWRKHPLKSVFFKKYQNTLPAFNLRMNNISAAIICPQIKEIERKVGKYNKNYKYLIKALAVSKYIEIPEPDSRERRAPDSVQFRLVNFSKSEATIFMRKVRKSGVSLYVFGAHKNNARVFWNWKYLNVSHLDKTKNILEYTCDIRLPIFFKKSDLDDLASVILGIVAQIKNR